MFLRKSRQSALFVGYLSFETHTLRGASNSESLLLFTGPQARGRWTEEDRALQMQSYIHVYSGLWDLRRNLTPDILEAIYKDGPRSCCLFLMPSLLAQSSSLGTLSSVWCLREALAEEPLASSCERSIILFLPTLIPIFVSSFQYFQCAYKKITFREEAHLLTQLLFNLNTGLSGSRGSFSHQIISILSFRNVSLLSLSAREFLKNFPSTTLIGQRFVFSHGWALREYE